MLTTTYTTKNDIPNRRFENCTPKDETSQVGQAPVFRRKGRNNFDVEINNFNVPKKSVDTHDKKGIQRNKKCYKEYITKKNDIDGKLNTLYNTDIVKNITDTIKGVQKFNHQTLKTESDTNFVNIQTYNMECNTNTQEDIFETPNQYPDHNFTNLRNNIHDDAKVFSKKLPFPLKKNVEIMPNGPKSILEKIAERVRTNKNTVNQPNSENTTKKNMLDYIEGINTSYDNENVKKKSKVGFEKNVVTMYDNLLTKTDRAHDAPMYQSTYLNNNDNHKKVKYKKDDFDKKQNTYNLLNKSRRDDCIQADRIHKVNNQIENKFKKDRLEGEAYLADPFKQKLKVKLNSDLIKNCTTFTDSFNYDTENFSLTRGQNNEARNKLKAQIKNVMGKNFKNHENRQLLQTVMWSADNSNRRSFNLDLRKKQKDTSQDFKNKYHHCKKNQSQGYKNKELNQDLTFVNDIRGISRNFQIPKTTSKHSHVTERLDNSIQLSPKYINANQVNQSVNNKREMKQRQQIVKTINLRISKN